MQNITLLYRTNETTCQSAVAQQTIEFVPDTSIKVYWEWDFIRGTVLPPGAEIYWQWQITDYAGNSLLTDEQSYTVIDPRHDWKLLTSGQLNVQWYQGNSSFGVQLRDIATQSLKRLERNIGVTPRDQIWITIYPTVVELQQVETHTSEWAAGLAYPEFQSSIMAIPPSELEWAAKVIPHELAHLVVESLIFNCHGIRMPTWLGEGLATFSEGDLDENYSKSVTSSLEKDSLPPLRTLESGFSSDASAAIRSYGQSTLVVAYLIDTYGSQKMADLLSTIQSGKKIDDALEAVYSLSVDELDTEWRASLGFGPQPTRAATIAHTTVPTLALWAPVVTRPTATPTQSPSTTPTQVLSTNTPESIAYPTQPNTVKDSTPTDPPLNPQGDRSAVVIIGVLIVFITAGALIVLTQRAKGRRKIK